MKKAILAKKVGMTQIFNEAGELVPVTVLQAGPCVVTQVKTMENDGYEAVQVGFEDIREKLVNKPVKGMFDKAGVSYKRYVREFKLEGEYSVKDEIKVDVFEAGDKIDATAIAKGKGFQGAIKRHGQSRGPMLMVLNTIDMQVQTVLVQLLVEYSRARRCLDTWVVRKLQLRILKWLELMLKRTYS